ncbi:hypothetical protein IV102_26360 [bacterium]|nr:hypothetical protein [bacterium]
MAVESEFKLSISNEQAGALNTPGQVDHFVCQQLQIQPQSCASQTAFQAIRQLLMEAGVSRHHITLERPLGGFPRVPWRDLEDRLGQRLRTSRSFWACKPQTVRELVILVREQLPGSDRHWTRPQVWERLLEIISEQLGVPKPLIGRDSDFVYDLGAC